MGGVGRGLFCEPFLDGRRPLSRRFDLEELREDEVVAICTTVSFDLGRWGLTRPTHQTSTTGGTTALLNFIAIAADLHKQRPKPFAFCHQALQELRPTTCIATHGRVDARDVVVVVRPLVANIAQIQLQLVIRIPVDADVDQVVVEQLRHAIDGALDGDIPVKQRRTVCAVVEQAVELVHVLHGHSKALVAEVHVFETLLDVLVCALQKAVELVDMLQEDVGDIGGRLLEALVQQMDAKDDLSDGLQQGMVVPLRMVTPVAAVGVVVGELLGIGLSTQQLLASLDAPTWRLEGHEARLAGCVEHRLLEGGLHRGQGVDGEGRGHDGLVALVLPFEGVAVVVEAAPPALGGSAKRNHGMRFNAMPMQCSSAAGRWAVA